MQNIGRSNNVCRIQTNGILQALWTHRVGTALPWRINSALAQSRRLNKKHLCIFHSFYWGTHRETYIYSSIDRTNRVNTGELSYGARGAAHSSVPRG